MKEKSFQREIIKIQRNTNYSPEQDTPRMAKSIVSIPLWGELSDPYGKGKSKDTEGLFGGVWDSLVLGGFLTAHLSWRWVFYLNIYSLWPHSCPGTCKLMKLGYFPSLWLYPTKWEGTPPNVPCK
jgi:hypothetical protein